VHQVRARRRRDYTQYDSALLLNDKTKMYSPSTIPAKLPYEKISALRIPVFIALQCAAGILDLDFRLVEHVHDGEGSGASPFAVGAVKVQV
jgi:hypothetical protein